MRLVRGPNLPPSADPVDPKAPLQAFPLIAKFPESVVKPDFHKMNGRLYQQDVPKPAEDSDEEEKTDQPTTKKRWSRPPAAPQRQWILQEQVDFLETMVARRQKQALPTNQLSTRYEGAPEHNPSRYLVARPKPDGSVEITLLPAPQGTIVFAQPAARKTYSLSEAEQVIQDQRNGFVRNLHDVPVKKPAAHLRLMNKLKAKAADDDEADDVMGDVTFRERKGGRGGGGRRELLESLGDGVQVSQDGVLGGTDDAMFGGKQRFGQFKGGGDEKKPAAVASSGTGERGADGAAMADDFYQRDVQAEYEELDYDANELFDDDDVDLGEGEVADVAGGYIDDEDEEDVEDLEVEEEEVGGAAGLASVAGFKMLLAKARGEVPADGAASADGANGGEKGDDKRPSSPNGTKNKEEQEEDHIAKIMAAADKAAQAAKEKQQKNEAIKSSPTESIVQTDEHGLRVITLEAVRREIWLNHGQIQIKRLMKIFDVKKKSAADRQTKFREVVKELCNMKKDPVGGNLLVLKQHYSNMA